MNKFNFFSVVILILGSLSSCTIPDMISTPSNAFPQSITETHTKTTLVNPYPYNASYAPSSSIYQSLPVVQSNPFKELISQQNAYQSNFQDNSNSQPQYIIVHPSSIQYASPNAHQIQSNSNFPSSENVNKDKE